MSEAPDAARAERGSEPLLPTALRVFVYAVSAAVIVVPLSVTEGVIAASVGAASGALGARFVARSALRAPAIVLVGLAGAVGVAIARFFVVDQLLVPASLGPAGALLVGETVVFGGGALVLSLVLRALTLRHRVLTIAEVGLIAGGFASLVIAHRHGAIHRPYELADPLIAMGEDPTVGVLAIGVAGALLVGLLLLSERSPLRTFVHLAVVALLLGVIVWTTSMAGLPPPPSTGGALGLQDDESQSSGASSDGRSQGRRNADELEFQDEYPGGGGSPDAVALFHDDYSPPSGYYYFRQNAFSQFNGRKLVAATRRGIDTDVQNHFPTNRTREVAWNPGAGSDRTSVETTIAMLADNSAPIGLEAPVRFVPATNPNPERFQRIYRTHSVPITRDPMSLLGRPEGGDPSWDDETRLHYLELPDDPRYRALAEQILAELPDHLASLRDDPVGRALAITHYLGQHGTYSLRSRHAGAEDPTADFLFGDLTGYCVHFSHAAVFLMRAVGVPARVGTGYAVAEQNRAGGSALLLRNTDQHAWPEVFVGPGPVLPPPQLVALRLYWDLRENGLGDMLPEDQGWVVLEALEEAVLASRPELALSPWAPEAELTGAEVEARMRALAEAAGMDPAELRATAERHFTVDDPDRPSAGWVVFDVAPATVIDGEGQPPDAQLQRLLGEMARGSQAIDDAPSAPRPMRELVRSVATPVGQTLLGLVFVVLLLGYAVKLYRAWSPFFGARSKQPKRIYRAALDRLGEAGHRRRWGESAETFAARERPRFPSLHELTEGHLAAAFGRGVSAARLERMAAQATRLRAELKAAVPLWRRVLGALNPFSWVRTR